MFINYIKIAFRYLIKNKTYSLINIIGFAIGLAALLIMFLYIKTELSFDNYHKDADNIYRVITEKDGDNYSFAMQNKIKSDKSIEAGAPYELPPFVFKDNPEVEITTRLYKNTQDQSQIYIKKDNQFVKEASLFAADKNIFQLFNWPLIKGDAKKVIDDPFSIVLSKSKALEYFGESFPIGKTLVIKRKQKEYNLLVSGIMEKVPFNSHVHPEIICSTSLLDNTNTFWSPWPEATSNLYIKLNSLVDIGKFEEKLDETARKNAANFSNKSFHLQALQDIYLHSDNTIYDYSLHGHYESIITFSIIALLIILIAGFNFITLSTARSAIRIKEIGIRKVVGASRQNLIRQLLGESIILSLIAFPLALLLAELFIPLFNSFLNTQIKIDIINNTSVYIGFVGLTFFIGLFAGMYTSLYLSAFNPVQMLSKSIFHGSSQSTFRRVLIGIQLSVFIGLTVFTLVIYNQIKHMGNTLGYNKDHLLLIDIKDEAFSKDYESFKNTLLRNPNILNVSSSDSKLPNHPMKMSFMSGDRDGSNIKQCSHVFSSVDYDYFETLQVDLVRGRFFSPSFPSDTKNAILLNETAINLIGGIDMVGEKMPPRYKMTIIGVVKDFHIESFYKEIEPTIYYLNSQKVNQIVVRISNKQVANTIAYIKEEWQKVAPEFPFAFNFIDEVINHLYLREQNFSTLVSISALLAVFIACLGLLGLSSLSVERRTKEIGIRKVLGASVLHVLHVFTKEYIVLVILSCILVWPIAYYLANIWLQDFAYKISVEWWMFTAAGSSALVIALLTISFNAIKAAVANPVESLRNE